MLRLDATTRAEYDALGPASDRAAHVVAAIADPVTVTVYDGSSAVRASGTMAAPWASASDDEINVGEIASFLVTNGGEPDEGWTVRFESDGRHIEGSFGLADSGADFRWSLATFETGQVGAIGTVVVTARGLQPVQQDFTVSWSVYRAVTKDFAAQWDLSTIAPLSVTGVPDPIEIPKGGTYNLAQHVTGGAPPYTFDHAGYTLPFGVSMDSSGVLGASADAGLGISSEIVFRVTDFASVGVTKDAAFEWDVLGVVEMVSVEKVVSFNWFVDGQQSASNEFPQYLLDDGGVGGPSRNYWNRELEAHWPAYQEGYRRYRLGQGSQWYFGNWRNAMGESNSSEHPFATVSHSTNSLPTTIEFDATALAQRWITDNKGAYLHFPSTGAIKVGGRLSATPPKLIVATPSGDVVFDGGYLAVFSTSSASPMKTDIVAELRQPYRGLLHWRNIQIPTDMISAKIVLGGAESLAANRTFTIHAHETDIPRLRAGAGPITPTMGLAAEVGEANLPGHPDVYMAGDFRFENFFGFTKNGVSSATRESPGALSNYSTLPGDIPGYESEWVVDDDGSTYLRTTFVHGDGRAYSTSSLSIRPQRIDPIFDDPSFPVDPATVVDEMYARCYMMMENDFHSTVEAIKWGLGFDLRLGFWHTVGGGYWTSDTGGNSGTPGTGLKVLGGTPLARKAFAGRWEYQGHSIRQHVGTCRPSGTPYQKYRPLKTHCSHNGPFLDQSPFGTEENMVSPTTVLEKGKWHCVEWRCKLNSIEGPYDEWGNGAGVPDGILECWVDGVHSFRRDGLIWRRHPEIGINGYWIVGVHGGVTPPRPGEILHHRWNHLVVAKRYIGPRVSP